MTSVGGSAQGPQTLDFGRAFTFPFKDPRWLTKTLIGGLFVLAGMVIVGNFFLFGYLAQLVRNVIARVEHPLPEWDDLGRFFVEGFKLFLVMLAYSAPILILVLLVVIPAAIVSESQSDFPAPAVAGLICLVLPLAFVVMAIMPAALVHAAANENAAAAFELAWIFRFIKQNALNYLLAIVVYVVANTLSQVGIILFCVGIVFTTFLSMVITAYAFSDGYRMATRP